MALKYKVGDRVKVKSIQWFSENCNDDYNVVFANGWHFSKYMSNFCGKELIIEKISYVTNQPHYMMKDNQFGWTDEMIEGLAEEEEVGLVDKLSSRWVNEFNLPNGYIFKDENGNVINAQKIVLEKKQKNSYPKTYEECAKVLLDRASVRNDFGYKGELLVALQKLLVCRDAYWKIAGDEMGLGKPWEPDWNNISDKYCIYFISGYAWSKECQTRQCPFAFPTPEMRDAFKENFDPDIEFCKEFL